MMIAFLFMGASITLLPFMNVAAKYLSTDYPTTQILWARYTGHLVFMVAMFMPRHGLGLLRATRPGVHIVRSLLMFVSTVCFFTALRWIPVPTASAINSPPTCHRLSAPTRRGPSDPAPSACVTMLSFYSNPQQTNPDVMADVGVLRRQGDGF